MKKKLIFVFSLILVFSLFLGVCYASSVEDEEKGVSVEETETTESPTLISRILDFLKSNKEEIISIGSMIGTAIYIGFIVYKNVKSVKKDNTGVKKELNNYGQTLVKMADSYNLSAEEINKLNSSYLEMLAKEEERDRMIATLIATTSTLLEIQTTVYANSKNLPSGIKDLVNVKYSKCLKTIENNATLKSIFDAIKQEISKVPAIEEQTTTEQVMQ